MIHSRHPAARKFVKKRASACRHEWVFTTPMHIRCLKCPAVGHRRATEEERAELKNGAWIYLMGQA